jgi:hypothetical protein
MGEILTIKGEEGKYRVWSDIWTSGKVFCVTTTVLRRIVTLIKTNSKMSNSAESLN